MKLEEAIKSTKFVDERHKATLNILYSAYWLKTHFSALLKENGLTTEQYNVMRILKGKHPEKMCIKDIGSRMIEQNSNVPRIIDRLLVKKLVKRTTSPADKRETLISLTERGIQQLIISSEAMEQLSAKVFGLTNEDSIKLNELLEKMRINDLSNK